VYALDDEVTVGRAPGCGIVLEEDTFVSQVHARVFRRGRETYVEDLGSTNGTLVNGVRIDDVTRLSRGDQVQFGNTLTEIVR
jgi:pSer/pThr/pTyr-binding forkhead associated (FHA) protein